MSMWYTQTFDGDEMSTSPRGSNCGDFKRLSILKLVYLVENVYFYDFSTFH